MAFWTATPIIGIVLILVLAGIMLASELICHLPGARKSAATFAWICTLLLPLGLLWSKQPFTVLDTYYGVISWLIAGSLALSRRQIPAAAPRNGWRTLAWTWAAMGDVIWLATGYSQNLPVTFAIGWIVGLLLLWGLKRAFQLPAAIVLTINSMILFVVLLPVVDWLTRPAPHIELHPEIPDGSYSYAKAKIDRHSFVVWWGKYLEQYKNLARDLFVPDPANKLPYLVRTNRSAMFFQSHIEINNLGFRGKDLTVEKGGAYRIVALGESTTFGLTLTPEHLPWPEVLEALIREKLDLTGRVEVINAGLPTLNLRDNLYRLQTKILALKPDMIISYHGWNGFSWLWTALPPVFEKHLPSYKPRPSRLLAKCEYRIRLLCFKRRLASKRPESPPSMSKLLESEYANAYRDLIAIARANGIRLVLATYSMAVTRNSDQAVIEFYREAFPAVYAFIDVNRLHSMLVQELARQNPDVRLVDTHPHLDSDNEKFIDLIHFCPEGDKQLGETFFEGIKDILRIDLARRPLQK